MITFRNITTGQEINVGNVKKVADGRIFFSVRNAGCGTRFLTRNICLTLSEQVENGTFLNIAEGWEIVKGAKNAPQPQPTETKEEVTAVETTTTATETEQPKPQPQPQPKAAPYGLQHVGKGKDKKYQPYFEGGVGISCYGSIVAFLGGTMKSHSGRTWDYHTIKFNNKKK